LSAARKPIPAPPAVPGLSLNEAAARIAAAYGLTIRYRETLDSGSGRVEVTWALQKHDSDQFEFKLELYCQPPIFGGGGWAGWFAIKDCNGLELKTVNLVLADEGLAGNKARPLTRVRFREWAVSRAPEVPTPFISTTASITRTSHMPKNTTDACGEIPESLQNWISDFCSGKVSVNVPHRMFATKENMKNIGFENAINLIRTDDTVAAYIAGDKARMTQVAAYTASCVHQLVLESFSTAKYPGD
jgi:hypothetical protein